MKYMTMLVVGIALTIALIVAMRPVSDARARQIDIQSQLDAERARVQLAQESARLNENLTVRRAITPALSVVANLTVYVLSVAAIAAAVVVIGAMARSTIIVSDAAARAAAQRMRIGARTIHMDKATRTYGLVFDKKMMHLANPNTEAVYRIDKPHESKEQAITALAQVQVAGVLSGATTAQHAAAATDAPLVVSGKTR